VVSRSINPRINQAAWKNVEEKSKAEKQEKSKEAIKGNRFAIGKRKGKKKTDTYASKPCLCKF
jgi:hypothetical protein